MSLSPASLGREIRKGSTFLNLKVLCHLLSWLWFLFLIFFPWDPCLVCPWFWIFSCFSSLPTTKAITFLEKSFYCWPSLSENPAKSTYLTPKPHPCCQKWPLKGGIHQEAPVQSLTSFPRHCNSCQQVPLWLESPCVLILRQDPGVSNVGARCRNKHPQSRKYWMWKDLGAPKRMLALLSDDQVMPQEGHDWHRWSHILLCGCSFLYLALSLE